jgi:hypothetical protein
MQLPPAASAGECELLERHRFKTHAEAKMAIFELSRASTLCVVGTLPSRLSVTGRL